MEPVSVVETKKIEEMSVTLKQAGKAFDFLADRNVFDDLHQSDWVFNLMNFQDHKGDEALCALAGFYLYVVEKIEGEKEQTRALRSTFAHDLNGATDELLLPRSSNYLEYFTNQFAA